VRSVGVLIVITYLAKTTLTTEAFFCFIGNAGMSVGEIAALRCGDVFTPEHRVR